MYSLNSSTFIFSVNIEPNINVSEKIPCFSGSMSSQIKGTEQVPRRFRAVPILRDDIKPLTGDRLYLQNVES
jgi:hypothetical protein